MVKAIRTPRKINATLLNIKDKLATYDKYYMDIGNKSAKFQRNILNLNENIAKKVSGGIFVDSHCTYNVGG